MIDTSIYMMLIHEIHVFELRIETNFWVYDPRSFKRYISSSERGLKFSGLSLLRDSNPDLWETSAALYQLSYQANWQLIVMLIDDKPVDDGYISIYTWVSKDSKAAAHSVDNGLFYAVIHLSARSKTYIYLCFLK